MVQAGPGTDATIQALLPHLDEGDILIDGGNTFYEDTIRRSKELANSGINFIGTGVSGGEKGALEGPSIMPWSKKLTNWWQMSWKKFQQKHQKMEHHV